MKLVVDLSSDSLADAEDKLRKYAAYIKAKAQELCERLSFLGAAEVTAGFSQAIYDGEQDVDIKVRRVTEKGKIAYRIVASGQTVLFLEFGAGVRYGYGHPLDADFGMGPGTYPKGKGHWNDPKGWWFKDATGKKYHSYGNPPIMAMYNTSQELHRIVEDVAREVFASDRP